MGMTIDEARTALGKERKYALHENKQAFDIAIDTMRKYQKIEQIMKSKKMNALNIGLLIPKDMACVLHEIKEVVEDGKID